MPISKNPTMISRAVFGVLFASVGFIALRFMFTPIRMKILTAVLDMDQYGTLNLIVNTVSFLVIVTSVGSLEFLLRRLPGRSREYQFGIMRRVVTVFGSVSVGVALGGIGLLYCLRPEKGNLEEPDYWLCGLLLVVMVHVVQRVYYLMGRRQYARSRLVTVLYSDAWFLPLLVYLWIGEATVRQVLVIWIVWLLLTTLLTTGWVPLRTIWREGKATEGLRDLMVFGIPVLPLVLGEWLFRIEDKYILVDLMTMADQGEYAVCINIAMVGFMAGTGILDLLMAEFNKIRNQLPRADMKELAANADLQTLFSAILRYALIIWIPLAAALCFAGSPVLRFLTTGPKYHAAAFILPYAAPVPLFLLLGLIFGRTLISMNRNAVVGAATLTAAIANIPLNYWLIPRMEEPGAAVATMISVGVLAVFLGIKVRCWAWISRGELMPIRLAIFLVACMGGFYYAAGWSWANAFTILAAGGIWCLAIALALGLIRKQDLTLVHLGRSNAS